MSTEFMKLREIVKYKTGRPAALGGQRPTMKLSKREWDCEVDPLGSELNGGVGGWVGCPRLGNYEVPSFRVFLP